MMVRAGFRAMQSAIRLLAALAIITIPFLLGAPLAGIVPADLARGSSSTPCCIQLDLASKDVSMSPVVGVDILGPMGRRVKRLVTPTHMTPRSYRTIWDGLAVPNNLVARGPQNLLRSGHSAIARSIMRE